MNRADVSDVSESDRQYDSHFLPRKDSATSPFERCPDLELHLRVHMSIRSSSAIRRPPHELSALQHSRLDPLELSIGILW